MALRIVEHEGLSDVGRQREANEDSYVVAEPLFVVADGMGGARAGEVASHTAAEVFEGPSDREGTAEEQLIRLTREANRRIYELAQRDADRRGMGTTLTAAMLTEAGLSIAHVGDSRAYRMRGEELVQLTDDHSLVAELQRSGQLTAEAAEHHPQKSVITRALGPESDVEVDSHTHAVRAGDVYLLCSDGLTGMIADAEVEAVLRGSKALREAAEALVRAANQSGGRDNITVVLLRIGEDGQAPAEEDTLSGRETLHGGLTAADVRSAAEEPTGGHAPVGSAAKPESPATTARRSGSSPRRSAARRSLTALTALAVLALITAGLYFGSRQVHFLGTDDAGLVTLYRGLPYELPLGIELYSARYTSSVPAQTVPAARRRRLLDHEWRSRDDAADLLSQLERGRLEGGRAGR